jgi:DNA-binding transcriptional MerR regulator
MPAKPELTYALGAVCRITGLSPHVLRVWERRYGAIAPLRTPKGTRRYRLGDVERLQLLRAAVEAGHRIGAVVALDDSALGKLASGDVRKAEPLAPIERAIAAIEILDAGAAERVIADQLLALGPVRFAREFAMPLLQAVGTRWFEGRLCVAAEHMASALLRSLLGAALRPPPRTAGAPIVLFATLPGEKHELGLLISALVAMGAGANPVFLGAELPPAELVTAAELTQARALALAVTSPKKGTLRELAAARSALSPAVEVWLGGPGASALTLPAGVVSLATLEDLERHVQRLHEQPAVRVLKKSPAAAKGRPSVRRTPKRTA